MSKQEFLSRLAEGLSGLPQDDITERLAFYGEMLTQNQRELARLNWEEDYSLSEIAEQYSVSRQSVHDTVSRTERQLEFWEEKLGLLCRFQHLEEGLKACEKELSQIDATAETARHLIAARQWVARLLDQEEE